MTARTGSPYVLYLVRVLWGAVSANAQSVANESKNPITVDDAIRMTRLGDAKGRVAQFSPDGKSFVILLRKGDPKTNTNQFSLLLFRTASALNSPPLDVLLTFSSSSNRGGISDITWLPDNETLAF